MLINFGLLTAWALNQRALGPSSSLTGQTFYEREKAARSDNDASSKRGLKLLAFDDGGARGLSMLLILRNMMREVQQLSQEPGRPCEYFDLIAGSGTGGLLALLIGRLRLTMDEAIECYTRLVERVFLRTKAGRFRDAPLEEILREICYHFGDGSDTQMLGQRGPLCKTFVCVREKDPYGTLHARRLRTYNHPAEPSFQCTIVEAVRATMGNPAFFGPPTLSNELGISTTFTDAGDDRYNPAFDLYEEAQSLFPSRNVAYFVSLGAGRADTIDATPPRGLMHQPRLPLTCLTVMAHLAARCDAIAEQFLREHPGLEKVYYRFTHDQGSVDGKMAQWEQVDTLKEFLKPYFISVDKVAWALESKMMGERKAELAARRGSW
ncbi:acyl transferase/acyl hydrolase/lysophospholipase [Schizophyllum commune]